MVDESLSASVAQLELGTASEAGTATTAAAAAAHHAVADNAAAAAAGGGGGGGVVIEGVLRFIRLASKIDNVYTWGGTLW